MKFLHTADLHIGMKLSGYSLDEDIEYALSQIKDISKKEGCTAVIVAGDIYDRSSPSSSAYAVFDSFVTSCAKDGIATVAVSGNHDAPERVAYMSSLLSNSGVHFSPVFDGKVHYVDIPDEYGEVRFYMLPFIRPVNVREVYPDFDGKTYTSAASRAIYEIKQSGIPKRSVMVTHQFVISGEADDVDENEVGGIGCVMANVFSDFSYTALGHIHRAYNVAPTVRYSGSPLKYSFSEAHDEKTVTVVEIDADGCVTSRDIAVQPLHDMREMRGSYEYVTSEVARRSGPVDDYLRIILTDDEQIEDVSAKLRTVYPNLMRIVYDNLRMREIQDVVSAAESVIDAISPTEVFFELFELQNNAQVSDEIAKTVREIFDECSSDIMKGERA